jgi:hypothetical protein
MQVAATARGPARLPGKTRPRWFARPFLFQKTMSSGHRAFALIPALADRLETAMLS